MGKEREIKRGKNWEGKKGRERRRERERERGRIRGREREGGRKIA